MAILFNPLSVKRGVIRRSKPWSTARRSLLPDPHVSEEQRALWEREINLLEAQGIR
ncbi:MAG: hypothetical protein R3C56_37630 [Pirellulaceae bacterium]